MNHPAGQCAVLGDTLSAVREVLLYTLHRNVRAGRNGNKHAMVPTRQGVLTAAAATAVAAVVASVAATDASAAAAADVARGAVKPTAVDDDGADGLCRRAYREPCHGLRDRLEPRRRASGRFLADLHL